MRHQPRRSLANLAKPARVTRGIGAVEFGEMLGDHEIGELSQDRVFTARRMHLEIAEAHERRRHPTYDGARLGPRAAVF